MALQVNKDLARKNFVKYAEQYRTLARIVNYSNEVHIDKIKEVIPDELQNALVIYEITNQSPKTWDDYLKLLMQAYKALLTSGQDPGRNIWSRGNWREEWRKEGPRCNGNR